MPTGNIQLTAAKLFTDTSNTKVQRVFDAASIVLVSASCYNAHKG